MFIPGCVQGATLCVCVTFVIFTDFESCTRPIYTNPGYMEAGEYGLTCGTCFVASRPEVVVAVAGLLSISWCVLGGVRLLRVFFRFVFVERTRPATNMRHPCLIYLSTSNKARPKEQIEPRPVFACRRKGHFIPGCVLGATISLVCRSVCVSVSLYL